MKITFDNVKVAVAIGAVAVIGFVVYKGVRAGLSASEALSNSLNTVKDRALSVGDAVTDFFGGAPGSGPNTSMGNNMGPPAAVTAPATVPPGTDDPLMERSPFMITAYIEDQYAYRSKMMDPSPSMVEHLH